MNSSFFERKFIIKRNDTLPTLSVNVKTRGCMDEVLPLSLTAVTAVTFSMSDDCGNIVIASQTATIVSYDNGIIQYEWQNGDTSTSGKFFGEFELFFTGGTKISLPQVGGINIQIVDDINQT